MSGGSTAISVIAKQMGISSAYDCSAMVSLPSETTLHMGRIIARSMMFAPTILPIDILDSFFRIAVRVVMSSGRLVPMATMVTPIIAEGTPSSRAISLPYSISSFEPTTIAAMPIINITICLGRSFLSTTSRSSEPTSFFASRILSQTYTASSTNSAKLGSICSVPSLHSTHKSSAAADMSVPLIQN